MNVKFFPIVFSHTTILALSITQNLLDSHDSFMDVTPRFSLGWTFNHNKTINFLVVWKQKSWVGLGFGSNMFGVDMNVAEIVNGSLSLTDRWSEGHYSPEIDKIDNLILLDQFINSTVVAYTYQRPLNTSDVQDKALQENQNYTFCIAWTGADQMEYHSSKEYQIFDVYLSKNQKGQAQLVSLGVSPFMYAHGILLFLAWGVVADIGIYSARYLKSRNQKFVLIHLVCFLFVDLTTIIMYFVSHKEFNSQGQDMSIKIHKAIAFILIVFVPIQHIGGGIIRHIVEEKTVKDRSFVSLMIQGHQLLGLSLLLLGKMGCLTGLFYNGSMSLYYSCLVFFCLQLTGFTYYERVSRQLFKLKRFIQGRPVYFDESRQHLMNMLNNQVSREEIIKALPDLKWVLFDSSVYDLTEFFHPAGNYIIENCVGREISRFFLGAYSLEISSLQPYRHGQKAFDLLQNYYIGECVAQNLFMKEVFYFQNKSQHSFTVGGIWLKTSVKRLSTHIYQVYFHQDHTNIRQIVPGVSWFGRHFTVSTKEFGKKTRLYTTVLSLSDFNRKRRAKILDLLENQGQKNQFFVENQEAESITASTLSFVIKIYDVPKALSTKICQGERLEYSIQGPYGLGLELKPESKGLHIAFVGGTGILPLMDLMDFLLQKAVYTILKKNNSPLQYNSGFQLNNYDQCLQDFQLKIYASFLNEEEFIESHWIRKLYQISKIHELNIFDMAIRYSNQAVDPVVPNIQERFDEAFISNNLLKDKTKKIYICGPPKMNKMVILALKQLHIDEGIITII